MYPHTFKYFANHTILKTKAINVGWMFNLDFLFILDSTCQMFPEELLSLDILLAKFYFIIYFLFFCTA